MSKTVINRSGWNATPPAKPFTKRRSTVGIVLHHSGVKGADPGPAQVKAFERYHMKTRGWRGIAYNWLVDADGVIYEGRGHGVVGGATRGWNSKTESICYTGWGSGDIPERALESIAWLVSDLQSRHGNKLWVKGHRDFASTSCPGTTLYHWLQDGMELKQDQSPNVDWVALRKYIDALGAQVAKKPLSARFPHGRGQAVRLVQRHLNGLGFDCGPVDGVYGRKTAAGVKAYQRSVGLKADGIVGKHTWSRMFL